MLTRPLINLAISLAFVCFCTSSVWKKKICPTPHLPLECWRWLDHCWAHFPSCWKHWPSGCTLKKVQDRAQWRDSSSQWRTGIGAHLKSCWTSADSASLSNEPVMWEKLMMMRNQSPDRWKRHPLRQISKKENSCLVLHVMRRTSEIRHHILTVNLKWSFHLKLWVDRLLFTH